MQSPRHVRSPPVQVLITNDDGIDSPGLAALAAVAGAIRINMSARRRS